MLLNQIEQKRSRTYQGSNPRLPWQKAHVPEGRYQTPPGIHFGLVQRPEFRLHWGFWDFDWDFKDHYAIPAIEIRSSYLIYIPHIGELVGRNLVLKVVPIGKSCIFSGASDRIGSVAVHQR